MSAEWNARFAFVSVSPMYHTSEFNEVSNPWDGEHHVDKDWVGEYLFVVALSGATYFLHMYDRSGREGLSALEILPYMYYCLEGEYRSSWGHSVEWYVVKWIIRFGCEERSGYVPQ
jgi:hypothetical protein